jgi:hypothetical protein
MRAIPSKDIRQVERKMSRVFNGKIWLSSLDLAPQHEEAVMALDQMLDYVTLLQKQVQGLEQNIARIKGGGG